MNQPANDQQKDDPPEYLYAYKGADKYGCYQRLYLSKATVLGVKYLIDPDDPEKRLLRADIIKAKKEKKRNESEYPPLDL
jgi:predicted NAD-dependent protein-ADP-ribosyltransferase YbiA (DUF1768 family)